MTTNRIHLASLAFLFLAASTTAARAEHTYESTRTVDGKKFSLLGEGIRKKFVFKVYHMGFYGEDAGIDGACKAGKPDAEKAPDFAVHGAFDKVAVMHFLRTVGADKIREAYHESLADSIAASAPGDIRNDANAFIALFDGEVKEGQEIIVRTRTDGTISVNVAGAEKTAIKNAKLIPAIWNIWLGSKPISGDLKKGMVEKLPAMCH